MILKGSQRGTGQNLAMHLMRLDENEHVELHQIRGFASDNLKDAFKEAEAISRGTKCRQYLFSLSLSPPEGEKVSIEQFEKAIEQVEDRLGLDGQPRAIVFHEKEGRRHAHCVWSRIDAQTMKARQLSFFKQKLVGLSRDLYLDHGWKMPDGLAKGGTKNPTNFTLAEWQQTKRQGIDPRWLKASLQECWKSSDNPKSFANALQERGFFLAKGDKRGYVILDHNGEVYSLPRMLGLKTKDVRERLGDGDDLKGVEDTKKQIAEKMRPAICRHIDDSRARFQKQAGKLDQSKRDMTLRQREARRELKERQKERWQEEQRQRTARIPKGMRGLWHRITGQYQKTREQNEQEAKESRERMAQERQAMVEKQLEQREVLQRQVRELRKEQAERLWELRKDVGRYLGFRRGSGAPAPARQRKAEMGLRLER
jgi:hypothetical protein